MNGLALVFFLIGGIFVVVGLVGFWITRRSLPRPDEQAAEIAPDVEGTRTDQPMPPARVLPDPKPPAPPMPPAAPDRDEAIQEAPVRADKLPDTSELIPPTPVPPPVDTGEFPTLSDSIVGNIPTEIDGGSDSLIGLLQQLPPGTQQDFLERVAELPSERQTSNTMRGIFDSLMNQLADNALKTAQFTAYYPRQAHAGQTYGLYVYAHLPNATQKIRANVEAFVSEFGGHVPKPALADQSASLREGAHLSVMPEADGLDFDPVATTKKWQLPYTRFDFAFTPPASAVGEILTGRVSILVGGIEIAHIPFATLIEAALEAPPDDDVISTQPLGRAGSRADTTENPLAAAKFTSSKPVSIYDKIFISYSRQDSVVAEMYRQVQQALGNDVFMDTHSIRPGEDWRAALANAIDQADIFQLFWSPHAAESEHVRMEWDYALKHRCDEADCAGFIRPVYWQHPLPAPPPELSQINFRYVPFAVAAEQDGQSGME